MDPAIELIRDDPYTRQARIKEYVGLCVVSQPRPDPEHNQDDERSLLWGDGAYSTTSALSTHSSSISIA
jgi:hypothetical protein